MRNKNQNMFFGKPCGEIFFLKCHWDASKMDSYISLTRFLVYYLAHLIYIFRIPPLKLFTFRTKYDEIGHSLQWRRETEVEDAKAKQERKPHSILRSKTASARSQRPSLYDFVQKLSGFSTLNSIYVIDHWSYILSCCHF